MSDVCVIIVTHNSRACFAELKPALEAQTTPFQLVVFDNASEPDQRPRAADFPSGATLLQSEENLGFAAANNRCAAMTSAPLIALLNPDAFPAPEWLATLCAAAERFPNAAAFGSTQINARKPDCYDGLGDSYFFAGAFWRGGYGAMRDAIAPREGYSFGVCAAAALYRSDAWRSVEGFDESLFCYGEDIDLAFRLRLRGWEIVQVADAIARHVGGGSTARPSDFETFHSTRNALWVLLKDMPAALLLIALPAHALKTAAHYALSYFRTAGRAYRRGVRASFTGLGAVLTQRKAIQRARSASTARIAAALTWSPFALLSRAAKIRAV